MNDGWIATVVLLLDQRRPMLDESLDASLNDHRSAVDPFVAIARSLRRCRRGRRRKAVLWQWNISAQMARRLSMLSESFEFIETTITLLAEEIVSMMILDLLMLRLPVECEESFVTHGTVEHVIFRLLMLSKRC